MASGFIARVICPALAHFADSFFNEVNLQKNMLLSYPCIL